MGLGYDTSDMTWPPPEWGYGAPDAPPSIVAPQDVTGDPTAPTDDGSASALPVLPPPVDQSAAPTPDVSAAPVPSVTGGALPTEPTSAPPPPAQPDFAVPPPGMAPDTSVAPLPPPPVAALATPTAPPMPDAISGGAAPALPPPLDAISGGAAPALPPPLDAISGGAAPALPPPLDAISGGAAPALPGDKVNDYSKDPLDNPDQAQGERDLENMSPEDYARTVAMHEETRRQQLAKDALDAATQDRIQAQANLAAFNAAKAKTDQQMAQLQDQAKQLANTKIDSSLSWGQTIAGALAAGVGGLAAPYMGGRNPALDMFSQAIARHMQAQETNLANKRGLLTEQMGNVRDQQQQDTEQFVRRETMRAALYEQAIRAAQAQAQNFDPRGTMALRTAGIVRGLRAQQQQALAAAGQKLFDNNLAAQKVNIEQQKADQEGLLTDAKLGKIAGAGAGAGAGSATNPSYTVASGLFDPFTKQPVMGKEKLSKDSGLQAQLNSYADEQNAWAKLAAVARQIDGHRSLGAQVANRFRDTDTADFDRARQQLMLIKLHSMGMRPTVDAEKAFGDLVPDLERLGTHANTLQLIQRAQEDNDRQYASHLNIMGIDGDSIIHNAQNMRAPAPEPSPHEQVAAAEDALATAPDAQSRMDAAAALDAARQRVQGQIVQQRQYQKDEQRIRSGAREYPKYDASKLPAPLAAAVDERNEAADTFNAQLRKYRDLAGNAPKIDEKQKGLAAKEHEDFANKVGGNAHLTIQYKDALDAANERLGGKIADLVYSSPDFGGVPTDTVRRLAGHLGFDASKFGKDMGGQVDLGKFQGALKRLADTPDGQRQITRWMFESR